MPVLNDTCPDCGAKLTADAPAGLCPQCLLRLGLGADLSLAYERPSGLSATQPHPLDTAILPRTPEGNDLAAPSRVLQDLDESIGPAPRVLLRDGPADVRRPVCLGSTEMPELSGESSRYQLLGEIARGGIGAILKGRDVDLGRDLAIKVLLDKHRDKPEMIRRFIEEAQIGGQLQHPGIVPVHELGRLPDGRFYIAMKMVAGRTLAALLEARKDPGEDRTRFLAIFEQVCQTLAYAHSRGVIHRDLKPSNVMVGNFGEVQVMDWGLAKVLDQGGVADEERSLRSQDDELAIRTVRSGSDAGDSHAGSVLGTPSYMAPEQARGALDVIDERADVFGLGSILCEILTGQPAFTGKTVSELYRKAERADLDDAFARLDACGAEAELVGLARSCLAPAPKNRLRDAGMVLADLTAYVTGVDQRLRAAELAQAKAEARATGERKRRVLSVALAASTLATAVLGGGAWVWVVGDRAQRTAKAARAINKAFDEAHTLRVLARQDTEGDLSEWDKAIEAAKRAETLLAEGENNTELRGRVQTLLTTLARERDAAKTARIVNKAYSNAHALHTLARQDTSGDLTQWNKAVEAAKWAKTLLAKGESNADLRDRVQSLLATLIHDRDAAALVVKDRHIVERLATIHNDLGVHLDADRASEQYATAFREYGVDPDKLEPSEAGARLASSPAAAEIAGALDQWAFLRRSEDLQDLAGARRLIAIAKVADPDPWRNRLRETLDFKTRDHDLETFDRLAETADTNRLPEASVARLALALSAHGRQKTAVDLLRRTQRIHPDAFWINWHLGQELMHSEEFDDAVRFYGNAVAVRPRSGFALHSLGLALHNSGRIAEAVATLERTTQIEPDNVQAWISLGSAWIDLGEPSKAKAAFCEAKALKPNECSIPARIAQILMNRGDWKPAIAEFHEAVRLNPTNASNHDWLGRALLETGQTSEAEASFREAIRLEPQRAPIHFNLGRALLIQGKADAALEKVEQVPSRNLGKAHRLPETLAREARRFVALDGRLPDILCGKEKPSSAAESAELAQLCRSKQLDGASARLWSKAFAMEPKLAEDGKTEPRYAAACAAACAGCGQGKDPQASDKVGCEGWRRQARNWLREELASYAKLLNGGPSHDRAEVPKRLGRWQVDPALAGIRDESALASLSSSERDECRQLWSEVADLKKQARNVVHASLPRLHD